jgi:hypothetical protein
MCSIEMDHTTRVPEVDAITAMTPAELDTLILDMDIQERRQQAALALLAARAEEAGTFFVDGHRTAKAWTQAACNWSGQQAARTVRLGRAFTLMPLFATACLAGEIGISQMHALARVASNPRVRDHLPGSEELLVGQAKLLDHDEFMIMLHRWEQLADESGADQKHERAHRNRRAAINILDELAYLDAVGPTAQGVIMREILERFVNGEFDAEWAEGVERHGDEMHPGLLERTSTQRRYDALFALFRAAAGSGKMGGDDILVNVVADLERLQREAARSAGAEVEPLDPSTVLDQRCETNRGELLHPADVLAMLWIGQMRRIVLREDGVVVDAGRRRRLFTGEMRRLVLLSAIRCIWPGCDLPASVCDADHSHPFGEGGHTCTDNGGPACSRHNWLKQAGYTTTRNADGTWTIRRPDGTIIGWRNNQSAGGN